MIVRILTEGQYELRGEALAKLDEIDNRLLDALELGDAAAFREALREVISHIRGHGSRLPDTALKESDLVLPPDDTTLEEARSYFAEYPRQLVP